MTHAGLRALVEQQAYRCALSGRLLTPATASLDHRVPIQRGGTHRMANIWVVHEEVNRAKGTMTEDEFVLLCHEVVAYYQEKQRAAAACAAAVQAN